MLFRISMMFAIAVLLTLAASIVLLLFLLWRLRRLRPATLAFADAGSVQLWQWLQLHQALIILTDSLVEARARYLQGEGEVWLENGPRVFVQFVQDETNGDPVVRLGSCGPGYVMEVAYGGRLAPVMLAVINGLRPICALSISPEKQEPSRVLWARLLWSLDGPCWFVLRTLVSMRAPREALERKLPCHA
jgi:hypothetical protein